MDEGFPEKNSIFIKMHYSAKKFELLLQIIIPWNFSDLFLLGSFSVQYFDHFLNYQVFDIVIQAIKKSKNIKVIQVFLTK